MCRKKKKHIKTPQKMSANWILKKIEIFLRMSWAVYTIYSQRLHKNLLVSKNSANFVVLTHLWPISYLCSAFTYKLTALYDSLPSFLTLFLEHKKHLIFNLCWLLAIPTNCRKKLSFHENEIMWNCQNTRLSSPCVCWKYRGSPCDG